MASSTHKVGTCLLCGRGMAGKAHLHPTRPIHHRIVEYIGGRRPNGWRKWPAEQKARLKPVGFRVVETVYFDQLNERELRDEVKRIIAALAVAVGLPKAEQVVRQVVHEQIRYRIPEAFRARAKQWQEDAAKWVRHIKATHQAKERAQYQAPPAKFEGRVQANWDRSRPREYTAPRAQREYTAPPAQYEGRTKARW